jgi:hypothetical protein
VVSIPVMIIVYPHHALLSSSMWYHLVFIVGSELHCLDHINHPAIPGLQVVKLPPHLHTFLHFPLAFGIVASRCTSSIVRLLLPYTAEVCKRFGQRSCCGRIGRPSGNAAPQTSTSQPAHAVQPVRCCSNLDVSS